MPEVRAESRRVLEPAAPPEPAAARPVPLRARFFRLFRVALAVMVAAIVGAIVWDNLGRIRSLQGFINGEIVVLKAPIAGDLTLDALEPGARLEAGAVVGRILNPRASALEIRHAEATSVVALNRRLFEGIEKSLAERRRLFAWLNEQARLARDLEVSQAKLRRERLEAELDRARSEARLARMRADRAGKLSAGQLISKEEADLFVAEASGAEAAARATEAELAQAVRAQEALAAGLLGFSESQKRALELETEILDLEAREVQARAQVETAEAELAKIVAQLDRERNADLLAPVDGIVWSVDAKSGEHVAETTPILKLVNTRRIWVDAFVAEQDAGEIRPGDPAEVRLLGPALRAARHRWRGRVESIRANTGRMSPGYEVAVPPPENVRRLVAVRVEVDWGDDAVFGVEQFRGVGRSVDVVFEKAAVHGK